MQCLTNESRTLLQMCETDGGDAGFGEERAGSRKDKLIALAADNVPVAGDIKGPAKGCHSSWPGETIASFWSEKNVRRVHTKKMFNDDYKSLKTLLNTVEILVKIGQGKPVWGAAQKWTEIYVLGTQIEHLVDGKTRLRHSTC